MPWRFSWFAALAFIHRWLGIAGCLLFLLWFISGIAMMYVRMPVLTADERLAHQHVIDAAKVKVSVEHAAAVSSAAANTVQLTMLGTRPVYRFGGRTPAIVYADTGERFASLSPEAAMAIARDYAPARAATPGYVGLLLKPDQWTLQSRAHFPLHHIALGDGAGTEIYVSAQTGEAVMDANARERFWAYVGPVTHWLYWPVLRRNGPLWTNVIIYSSVLGCVLCVLGLLAGVLRFSPWRRFSVRGQPAMSPYVGWVKRHHYAGLLFGVITFTWTFSGLLSMGPFPLLSSGGMTAEQRDAVTGTPSSAGALTADAIRTAIGSARSALQPKDLTLIHFRGHPYWLASESLARHVLVDAVHPEQQPFQRFDDAALGPVAAEAVAGATVIDSSWLTEYDDYYYDRERTRALPVLRVRYGDRQHTWMYFDPGRGAIALVVRDKDRVNRWLYHGLHSLDFGFLYTRRPAWDVVVIALSLGGLFGVATSVVPAWRRLRRHASRLAAR